MANPKIGIVSGVGPLAGANVLEKVFRCAALNHGAMEDAEYPDVIFINHGIDGVGNVAAMSDNFKNGIVSIAGQLENNGATIIGIACNTAHLYLNDIRVGKNVKIVNLIDEVAKEAAKSKQKYLLLTSATTREQKLYHGYLKKYGVGFSEVSSGQQKKLDEAIGLIMAYKLTDAGALLTSILKRARNQGFDAVIAGCTELPIAIDYAENTFGMKVIDSNYVLASALTDAYYSGENVL